MSNLHVSEIRYIPATATERATGLLGFVSFLINDGLRLDGVTVRRTLAGAVCLAWPTRVDRLGEKHAIVRPVSEPARLDLEAQVLGALGLAASDSRKAQGETRP